MEFCRGGTALNGMPWEWASILVAEMDKTMPNHEPRSLPLRVVNN
jgi:hypothetical protein